MKDYIKWIRSCVWNKKIILNFSAACILNEKWEILLQKRWDCNKWWLPWWALEPWESAEDALYREVKEETWLDIEIRQFIWIYSKYFAKYSNWDESQTIVFFFIADQKTKDLYIDNDETLDLQFFNKNNLPELFNIQHQDMINDFLSWKTAVYK